MTIARSVRAAAMFFGLIAAAAIPSESSAEQVDVALILAIDHSHSINDKEWELQIKGYASALRSDEVAAALEFGGARTVAITAFQWAGHATQAVFVPWTFVRNRTDLMALADVVESKGMEMVAMSCTSISGAMTMAEKLFAEMPFQPFNKILDISGDGPDNCASPDIEPVRKRLIDSGVTINGLPIDDPAEMVDIVAFYQRTVIGGRGAFMITADGFERFGQAVQMKLAREIALLSQIPGGRQ